MNRDKDRLATLKYLYMCTMPATCGEVADAIRQPSSRTSYVLRSLAKKRLVSTAISLWRITDDGRQHLLNAQPHASPDGGSGEGIEQKNDLGSRLALSSASPISLRSIKE